MITERCRESVPMNDYNLQNPISVFQTNMKIWSQSQDPEQPTMGSQPLLRSYGLLLEGYGESVLFNWVVNGMCPCSCWQFHTITCVWEAIIGLSVSFLLKEDMKLNLEENRAGKWLEMIMKWIYLNHSSHCIYVVNFQRMNKTILRRT